MRFKHVFVRFCPTSKRFTVILNKINTKLRTATEMLLLCFLTSVVTYVSGEGRRQADETFHTSLPSDRPSYYSHCLLNSHIGVFQTKYVLPKKYLEQLGQNNQAPTLYTSQQYDLKKCQMALPNIHPFKTGLY